MKLTHKLTLAFLLVSLIAIGLAALVVWTTTSTEFNNYIVDQRQTQFIAVATDYYQAHGNWRGVDTALHEQGLLPPFASPGSTRLILNPLRWSIKRVWSSSPAGNISLDRKYNRVCWTKASG